MYAYKIIQEFTELPLELRHIFHCNRHTFLKKNLNEHLFKSLFHSVSLKTSLKSGMNMTKAQKR